MYRRKDRVFLVPLSGFEGWERAFAALCVMDRDEEAIGVTGWHSMCWQGKKPLERKEPMATNQLGLMKHLWVCQVRDVGSWPGPCCLIWPKTVLIMSPH